MFTDRIIHYFFYSLICLLFFKLDPELRPPAESLPRGGGVGGLGQLRAAEVEGAGRVVVGGDDSTTAAEDIALKDTTWGR